MSFDPKKYMTSLKGKDYLEVKWRIVWFREQHGTDGAITTEVLSMEPLIVRATVTVNGNIIATGLGSANADGRKVIWSGREIEKAETAAIGRALAHAGFGTQFTDEDEGEHLADSPVERTPGKQPAASTKLQGRKGQTSPEESGESDKVLRTFECNAVILRLDKHGNKMIVARAMNDTLLYGRGRDHFRKAGYDDVAAMTYPEEIGLEHEAELNPHAMVTCEEDSGFWKIIGVERRELKKTA